ncbi:hypothetical protein HMPREF0063_10771 [Aeromicrobium marinum DSM 15272]|uniref:Polyketide cyclase/dehydrase n=1 Tax=Aeromicrobium marinum DSM 15272 TaxID=585531 RepID=E2S9Y1_9ACTN|nr:SRPBCC family protein [Aeromicrobium marinum]EFQ84055.1 hypothetical protein HMPREF0063_10771 [Aeromicrobium marinum DSM 15272]
MALIEVVREVPLSVDEAWGRLTDWSRHGDHAPLTSIELTPTGFNARTGLGRLGFDDPMDVVQWAPPHHCRIEKRGRVVLGWAEITVEEIASGSRVRWVEEIHVRGVPRFARRIEAAAGRRLFSGVIDELLA